MKTTLLYVLATLVASTTGAVGGYDEKEHTQRGVISYLSLYRISCIEGSAGPSNGISGYCITSTLRAVTPENIALVIDTRNGEVPIDVDKELGTFTLPFSKSLLEENPAVRSNQEEGTLEVQYYYDNRITIPKSGIISLRALVAPAILARTVEEIGNCGNTVVYPTNLLLEVEGSRGSNIVIKSRSGPIEIPKVTGWWFYKIPLRPDLLQENPDVSIPGRNASFMEDCGWPRARRVGGISRF